MFRDRFSEMLHMGLLCIDDIRLFSFVWLFYQVLGEGAVSLHIQSYNNPASKSLTGDICAGQCVNTFTITLFTNVQVGGTLLEEVKQIHSNDDIGDMESFSSTLGTQWDNPLLINFVGKVRLKFALIVIGVEKNYPNSEYTMASFAFDQTEEFSDRITLQSGSASLTFSYNASCAADYYGTCNKMCVPRDSRAGHYTCNSSTGDKICLDGWRGEYCNTADSSDDPPVVTNNPITESGDVSPSEEGSDTENSTEEAPVTEQDVSKQESKLKIDMDTVWKITAICSGLVIGTVVVILWIWYQTKYKKKRSMPKIVVSNEKLFEKTGKFLIEREKIEPSAPGEDILARDQNGNLAAFSKDNNLTSYSIPNVNNNSTPPPVEQPDRQEL